MRTVAQAIAGVTFALLAVAVVSADSPATQPVTPTVQPAASVEPVAKLPAGSSSSTTEPAGSAAAEQAGSNLAELTGRNTAERSPLADILGPSDNFHVLRPGVAYRSGTLSPGALRAVLQHYGIAVVVNLRGDNTGTPWYDAERAVCAELGVRLVDIRMSAAALPDCRTLLELYETFSLYAGTPLLMHCKSGADRTGAAAAIWRIVVEGYSNEEALRELSPFFGHFSFYHPQMSRLARMFVPCRTWIEHDYPAP